MVACVGIVSLYPRKWKWNKDEEEAWRKDLGGYGYDYDYGV